MKNDAKVLQDASKKSIFSLNPLNASEGMSIKRCRVSQSEQSYWIFNKSEQLLHIVEFKG